MAVVTQRHIVRACKQRGWTIQPVALQGIEEYLSEQVAVGDQEDSLKDVLDALADQVGRTLTAEIWNQSLEQVVVSETKDWNDLQIYSAFETPKLVYERKSFAVVKDHSQRCSLFGTPQDKIAMLAERYALVQQRILRHALFQPTELNSNTIQHKLTPIESLLGQSVQSLVLGVLVHLADSWYLEDPTGRVPISVDTLEADIYAAEHYIVLAEGVYQDGIFHIHRLGHPLAEDREKTLEAIRQQVRHDRFANKPEKAGSVVLVANVPLDQPIVAQNLEGLLTKYPHHLIVLMGVTAPSELSSILAKFPDSRVVVVSNEAGVWPWPRQTEAGTTNPSRLQWGREEMVVFRPAGLHESSVLCRGSSSNDYCRTLLEQGHLIPSSGVPIYWQAYASMSLYPLPTVLVVADDDHCRHDSFLEVDIIQPGSFAKGEYAIYNGDCLDTEDMMLQEQDGPVERVELHNTKKD